MSIENSTPASDSSSNPGTTDAGQCSMASPLQAASSSTATASKPVDTAAPVGISQGGSQGSQPETDHCILGLDGQVWKPSQRATVVSWVPARWAIFEPSFKVSLATRPDDTKGASLGYAIEGPDWLDPIDRQFVQVAGSNPETTFKAFLQRWEIWAEDIIGQLSEVDLRDRYPELRVVLEKERMGDRFKDAFDQAPVWSQDPGSRPVLRCYFDGQVWDCSTSAGMGDLGAKYSNFGVATMQVLCALVRHHKRQPRLQEPSIFGETKALLIAYALWHALRVIGFPLSPTPSDDRTSSSKLTESTKKAPPASPAEAEAQAHGDGALPPCLQPADDIIVGLDGHLWRPRPRAASPFHVLLWVKSQWTVFSDSIDATLADREPSASGHHGLQGYAVRGLTWLDPIDRQFVQVAGGNSVAVLAAFQRRWETWALGIIDMMSNAIELLERHPWGWLALEDEKAGPQLKAAFDEAPVWSQFGVVRPITSLYLDGDRWKAEAQGLDATTRPFVAVERTPGAALVCVLCAMVKQGHQRQKMSRSAGSLLPLSESTASHELFAIAYALMHALRAVGCPVSPLIAAPVDGYFRDEGGAGWLVGERQVSPPPMALTRTLYEATFGDVTSLLVRGPSWMESEDQAAVEVVGHDRTALGQAFAERWNVWSDALLAAWCVEGSDPPSEGAWRPLRDEDMATMPLFWWMEKLCGWSVLLEVEVKRETFFRRGCEDVFSMAFKVDGREKVFTSASTPSRAAFWAACRLAWALRDDHKSLAIRLCYLLSKIGSENGMTAARADGESAPASNASAGTEPAAPSLSGDHTSSPAPAASPEPPTQPLEAPIFVEGVEGLPWQVGDILDSKIAFLWGGICSANVHAASRVAPDGSIERGTATRLPFWCDEEDQKYVSVGDANQATVLGTSFRRLTAWGRGLIDLMGRPELLLYRHPMLQHLLLADEGAGEKLQLAFRMAPIWRGLGVEPEPIDVNILDKGLHFPLYSALLPKSPGNSAQSPSLALALVKAIGSAIRAYKTKSDEVNAKINLAKRQRISDLMLESDAFRLAYALSQALAAIGFRVSPPIVATAKAKGFFRDESGEEWEVVDHGETIDPNDLGCCEIYKASSNTHGFEGVLIRGPRWLDDADQQQIQVAGYRSDITALKGKFGAGLLRWLGQEQLFRDIEVRGGDTSDTSWQKLGESLLKRHPLLWCATKLCQSHGFEPKFHRGANGSIGFFGRHEFVASAGKDVLEASCLAVRRLVRTVKEGGFTVLSFRLAYLLKEQARLASNTSESPAIAASLAPASPEAPPASPEAHAATVSPAEPIQATAEPAAAAEPPQAAESTQLGALVNWIQFFRESIVTARMNVLRNVALSPKPGQFPEFDDPAGTSEELAVKLADMIRKRTGALGAAVLASDAPAPDILVHENITPLMGEPPPMTFNVDPNKIDHAVLYTMSDADFVALTTAVPFRAKEADGTLWVAKGDWTPILSFEGDLQLFKAVSAGGKGDGFIVQGPEWITDKGDRIAVQAAGVDREAVIEAAKIRLTVWAEGLALVFRHVELLEEMFPTLMRQLENLAIEKDFILTLTKSWQALDTEDQISTHTEWDNQVYPVLVELKAGESTVSAEGRTQSIALFKAAIRLLRAFDFRKREKAQAILALSLAKALRAIGFPVHPLIVSDEGGFVADGWRFVDLKVTRKAESHLGFVPLVFAVHNSRSSTDGVLARGPAWMTEEEQRQVQVVSTSREQAIGQIEETWKEWSCDLIRKVVGRADILMKHGKINTPVDGVDFAKVPRRYHALNGVPAPVPVPKDAPARFVEIPMKWLRKDFPLLDRVMVLANALAVSVGANVYEAWHPGATEPVYLLHWVVLGFLPYSFVEGSTVAEVVTEGLRTLVARLDRGAVGHAIAVRLAHEIFHFVKMQPEAWVSPHKIFEPGKGEEPAAAQKPAEPAPAAPREVMRGLWVTGPVGPTGSAGSFGREGPTGATVWTGPVRPEASAAPVPSETAPSSAAVEPKVTEAVDSMPIFTMPDAVRYHRVGDGREMSAPSGEPRPGAVEAPSAEPEATEEGAYRAGFKYGVDHPKASLDIQAKPLGLYPGNQDFRIAWEQGFLDERSARVLGHNTKEMSDAGIEAPSFLSPAVHILRLFKNYREVVEALGLPPSASHDEVISKVQQTLQPAKTIALEEAPLLPQEPVEAPPAAPVLRGVPGCDGREWLPEDEAKWQVSALAPWSRAEFYGQLHKAHAVVDGSMIPEHGFVIRGPGWLLDEDRFGLQVAGDDQQEVVRLYVERWKLWASQHLASVGGHAKVSEDQATKMFFLAYDKHGPTRRAIAIPSLDEVRASLLRQHEFETGVLCDGEEAGSSAT